MRDRVLDKIPADVTAIVAADGRALSHPRFRAVVDAGRTLVPAGLDCVLDAALASEHVAAGMGPAGELTIAFTSRARVQCPAASRVEDDLWIATLGSGAPAVGASVLTAEDHERARPYLREAPVALFAVRGGLRVLATAQPEPMAAWIAFDAADVESARAFERDLRGAISAAGSDWMAATIAATTIQRTGSQVVARIDGLADVATPASMALQRLHVRSTERTFRCPMTNTPPVVRCEQREHDHNQLEVYSLPSAIDEILAVPKEAAVINGRVEGVRLRGDLGTYGLAAGDLLVAVNGKRLTSLETATAALQNPRERIALLISRAQRFGTIELVEH